MSALDLGLFTAEQASAPSVQVLGPGACVLRRFALREQTVLLAAVREVTARSPFRRMLTPGGQRMSVENDELRCARLDQRPQRVPL